MRIGSRWLTLAFGAVLLLAVVKLVHSRARDAGLRSDPSLEPIVGQEIAEMTTAPEVPPAITRRHATRVILDVEIREEVKEIADGVKYMYWTFGGETPAKFIRVREGDLIETHLHNHPDNQLAHNIDFHGATGPGGGGEASFVAPGHSAVFSWRAMRPGLFLYHCVAAPAGVHISNGMYGLILVEPRAGMPHVDREFYVCQGEFYTNGVFGAEGMQEFDIDKALHEEPEYVVFNGHVGALMGDQALRVKVGERVRLYLGNAGPSLTSSFHVVGEIFDNVYGEGGSDVNQHNVQTTMIPVGGSAMVEFKADVPGEYTLVDHSMFRTFNKGSMGQLIVEGPAHPSIFSGQTSENEYQPTTRLDRGAGAPAAVVPQTMPELMAEGGRVYASTCNSCHQLNGQGLRGAVPPVAHSDYLLGDERRGLDVLLRGLRGDVAVNGQHYRSIMPELGLSDAQIAGVLTYARNSFGNHDGIVTVAQVAARRARLRAPQVAAVARSANAHAPASASVAVAGSR